MQFNRGTGGGRGGWRGYRSGRAGRTDWRTSRPAVSQAPEPGLGTILQTLDLNTIKTRARQPKYGLASITDCSLVTSFNWMANADGGPTIMIPGEPPRWTPLLQATRLSEDSGVYFRDKNAARFPQHPMEPTAIALLDADPTLPSKLDLVLCGSTFANLLRFVDEDAKYFRILVELVNETVFFVRREKSPTEKIEDVRGYGHTFPEAYTTWSPAVAGSESHQRILKYNFGGLHLALRFESDAYEASQDSKVPSPTSLAKKGARIDSVISGLAASDITITVASSGGDLTIRRGGSLIPQEQTFDIKTRTIKKKDFDTLSQELPRLWARRIPKFLLAHHTSGRFDDIEMRDIGAKADEWEKQHTIQLAVLAKLIHEIVALVREQPDGRIELRCTGDDKLEIRKQLPSAGDVLSAATTARWARGTRDEELDEKYEGLSDDSNTQGGLDFDWDDEDDEAKDYTACSADSCGYCGKCTY